MVEGHLLGSSIRLLVDTGASISMLSLRWWNRLQSPPYLNPHVRKVVCADGRPMAIRGRISCDLRIGEEKMGGDFLVADISPEGILGADLLKSNGILVDMSKQRLLWTDDMGGREVEGEDECRVVLSDDHWIPGGQQKVVEAEIVGNWSARDALYGIVEGYPLNEFKEGVRVGRGIVSPTKDQRTPVILLNMRDSGVWLRKNMALGRVEPVQSPDSGDEGDRCAMLGTGPEAGPNTREGEDAAWEAAVSVLLEGVDPARTGEIEALVRRNKAAFSRWENDFGQTDLVQHEIVTGDAAPTRSRPRRMAPHRREVVDVHVKRMLEMGVIEESDSPWASPVVLAAKKDGTVRFCVDYRRLNDVTRKDAYPLPRVDDSLDSLTGASWFSTLDLVSGYWQVGLSEKDQEKSAFVTHGGLYQYKVLPFGLCNAPSTFERLMEVVLRGLQFNSCLIYLDDIIVFGPDFETHAARLEAVLTKLAAAGLKVKPRKCQLGRREVTFLGHIVRASGVSTDPDKIKSVAEWPVPASVGEVRSFLGLAGYYRTFVKDFATVAKPLSAAAEKDK